MSVKGQIEAILKKKLSRALSTLPRVIGTEAVNWSKDRFRQQNWVDTGPVAWKARKAGDGKRKGRGILTDTARLRRSIRIITISQNRVTIGTDTPYARVHNYGFKGKVTVSAHKRRTAFGKRFDKAFTVPSHSRQMNIPQRRFLGNSQVLRSILAKSAKVHMARTMRKA